jgi:Rod binding domain-containing protein
MATSISTASLTSQASLLQSTEDRMLHQLKSQPANKDDSKIEKGAKEFEAMLLTTWLQQAEQSIATVPGAEDDEDAAGREQMMSLGVQSVATSLAASGGIGIGRMIAQAMHSMADKANVEAQELGSSAKEAAAVKGR